MTTTPLCFVDTETTGVHPGRRPWEIALIRRDADGTETRALIQISDLDVSQADPFGLKVGGFYDRYLSFNPTNNKAQGTTRVDFHTEAHAARSVEEITRGTHLVGVVPSFDAQTLDDMLRRHRLLPAWHYHLVDVEAMAGGYLHQAPPWSSDELSRRCGIDPPNEDQRHTAMGDADWAQRWYDALIHPDRVDQLLDAR